MRFTDWQARLIALIEQRKTHRFEWGVQDCCLWPADAVLAMTGVDHAANLRGTYSSSRGGGSVLRQLGGLAAAMALCRGPEVPPLCAQVGDVGLVRAESGREVGAVCLGEQWIAAGKDGLGLLPLEAASRAWRVA